MSESDDGPCGDRDCTGGRPRSELCGLALAGAEALAPPNPGSDPPVRVPKPALASICTRAGLVESYDAEKGRYQLLVKGRVKPLGVKVACCKLEFAAEQEQREHEATRRARVGANVRAALAAREPEAEAGSTS
eukprot:COSAG06_NODE_6232_length_3027_cov_15.461292_1_plen_133_part_00